MAKYTPSPAAIAKSRQRFARELENPEVRRKLALLIKAEVGSDLYGPQGRQAFIETVMNRSMLQGVSLQATIENRVTGTGKVLDKPLRKGYYQPLNSNGSITQGKVNVSENDIKEFDRLTKSVLAGSNLTQGGAHNASGSWGVKHIKDVRGSNVKSFSAVQGRQGELIYNKPGEEGKIESIWQEAENSADMPDPTKKEEEEKKEETQKSNEQLSESEQKEAQKQKEKAGLERIPEEHAKAIDELKKNSKYKNLENEEIYDIVKKNAEQFKIPPERLTQLLSETKTDEQQKLERIAFGKNIAPKEAQETIAKAAIGLIDPGSKAIDASAKVLGLDETKDRKQIMEFLATGGKSSAIDPKSTAWCGAFVNASLQQAGLKSLGAKGLVATSYMNWGKQKKASETQKGDIVVIPRGRSPGQTGGHVGIATGETKVVNGQLYVKIRGGNQRGEKLVSEDWYPASKVNVRRATENEFSNELKEAIKRGEVNPEYLKSVGYPVPDQVTQEAKREMGQEQIGISRQTLPAMTPSQQFEYDQYMAMRSKGKTDEEQLQLERQAYEAATGKQLVDIPDVMDSGTVAITPPSTESAATDKQIDDDKKTEDDKKTDDNKQQTISAQKTDTGQQSSTDEIEADGVPSIEPLDSVTSLPTFSTSPVSGFEGQLAPGEFSLSETTVTPEPPAPPVTPAPQTKPGDTQATSASQAAIAPGEFSLSETTVTPEPPAPPVTPAPQTKSGDTQATPVQTSPTSTPPSAPATYRGAQEAGISSGPTGAAGGSQRAAEEQSMKDLNVAQTEQSAKEQTEQQLAAANVAKQAAAQTAAEGGGAKGGSNLPGSNSSDHQPSSPGSTGQGASDESLCWV